MQLVATTEQMQEFDRAAIKGLSIPGLLLMENAGRAFVDSLQAHAGSLADKSIVVLCGKGNNGGDGFVIARHCANRGARVHVILLARPSAIKGDAAVNLKAIRRMSGAKGSGLRFSTLLSAGSLRTLRHGDIVIDAIFGTGFEGEPRGIYRSVIDWINSRECFVASVDVPSGVNGTTGGAGSSAVRADLTVTMGLGKIGHYVGKGRDLTGTLSIADISIPGFLFKGGRSSLYRVLENDVRNALPSRSMNAHKYSVGKVYILGGSMNFTGAPFMTSEAALRSGAGAVVLGFPKTIHRVMARKLTEVILQPLPETPEGTLSPEAFLDIRSRIEWADVVAIGPGLSRNGETDALVLEVLEYAKKPVVVDADALTAIAGRGSLVRRRKAPTVLTPHSGELSRLTGWTTAAIEQDRVEAARESAKKFNCVMVLKGSPTVTATPDGVCYLNSTGNPGMATVGAGDVLTGLLAGLIAQGMSAAEAAWSAVYVHGSAGDCAAVDLGERSLLAMDICDRLHQALMKV